MKNFPLTDSSEQMAVRVISAPNLSPKTFDSYFLEMILLGFMKNFPLSDSSELMAVGVKYGLLNQKRLIPTF